MPKRLLLLSFWCEKWLDILMIKNIFIDTNCFIHLRDIKDLPWREIYPDATSLNIYVAPVVISELDKHKVSSRKRLRDRSRAALNLIERASSNEGMCLTLRTSPININLVIADGHPVDWATYPQLDSSRQDDHLIAAALIDSTNLSPTIVSFDTGPLIRARSMQMDAFRAPDEWALPAPKDEKMERLQQELKAVRATYPSIEVMFSDQNSDGLVNLIAPILEPLSDEIQAKLLEIVKHQHPQRHITPTTNDFFPILTSLHGISSNQVADYYNEYRSFIHQYERQFANLHDLISKALTFGEIRYQLKNCGAITATNTRVEIRCATPQVLFVSRSEMEPWGGALTRVEAPSIPSNQPYLAPLLGANDILGQSRRDPTGFYWQDRPKIGEKMASLVCEEFRAKEEYSNCFYLFGREQQEGDVSIKISAKNLAEPMIAKTAFRNTTRHVSWHDPFVLRRLPVWISEIIESSF